jgi:hypothetical protein
MHTIGKLLLDARLRINPSSPAILLLRTSRACYQNHLAEEPRKRDGKTLNGQFKPSTELVLLRAGCCSTDLLLAKAPCGPKSTGATGGVIQLLGLLHIRSNDTLKNELGYAIAEPDLHTVDVASSKMQ